MTIVTKSSVKLTLGDFAVEPLGVEYPDYFQGYGLEPSTKYTDCAYGIGDTEAAALEDCLETMAQSCPIDFDAKVEKRIRDEYGRADNRVTAADELGIGEDTDVPLCGPDSTFDESPAYWHVGIKWCIREEQRIQRIQKLPNIQPLQYESYEALFPSVEHIGNQVWGYVYRADGSASYGDFKDDDWPESAEAYLNTLCDDSTETSELYFYVPCASGSDYSGSTVEAANAKCIEDTYGENEWVHTVYGGYNTFAVAIGLTGLLTCDDDTFDEFCEALEGLEDYPVIDEDALYELEAEKTDEAWKSWCRDSFVSALEKEHGGHINFEWPDDPELWSFFHECAEKANTYWYCEGYGSDMYIDVNAVVKEADFDDYGKWAVRYKVTWNDCGADSEVYHDEDEATGRVASLRASGHTGAHYVVLEPESTDKSDETDKTN